MAARTLADLLREGDRPPADPQAFIKDIDALGTYTPGQRESENVVIGARIPPWDEFMSNLGAVMTGYGDPRRETIEQQLGHINPPSVVKRVMETYRNRHIYPSDPMLPGPRDPD